MIRRLTGRQKALAHDRRGVVAVAFALSLMTIMMAVGAAIDLARAYMARQQLSAVAALTCQYANRPTIVMLAFGSGGATAYSRGVNAYSAIVTAQQKATWQLTAASPFTYVQGGAGGIALAARVPTTILRIVGITALPIGVTQQCFAVIAAPQQQSVASAANPLVREGFENVAYNPVTWVLPNGTAEPFTPGPVIVPVNTPPASAGYVGSHGAAWVITGYCLEIDTVGETVGTVPDGTHSAELDCDNGRSSAGNSSISTNIYLPAGSYELRWDYAARVANARYGTSYICGTAASDTAWATDTSYSNGAGAQTNRVNVYLDQNATGSPPVHVTLDGTQTLAGANLIDACAYSSGWLERSVPITVATAGFYWLSFAADGANDSAGGQVDNIRLCAGTCAGTASDDFPVSWTPASNGGNNAVLFQDNFETPGYLGIWYNILGIIGLSTGSSTAWNEAGQGWAMAGINDLPYWMAGCAQGTQCIQIGWEAHVGFDLAIARPFLLDPGYYQIGYYYVPQVTFSGLAGTYCGATPAAAGMPTLLNGSGLGMDRVIGLDYGLLSWASGTIGVFMSHAQLASEPNVSTVLDTAASYTNPDGTVTSAPTVPPNAISLTSFSQSATSPLIDICGYAATPQWRTASVYVQKPAYYWLMFSALGAVNGFGAIIDSVTVTALGSPRMANPPSNAVTLPVPNPQPGASIVYSGFSIQADKY